jgi:hypothetical protein
MGIDVTYRLYLNKSAVKLLLETNYQHEIMP